MSTQTYAEKDLTHIQTMISELEYLDCGHNTAKANVVMQPDYWRTRIRAVLALPNISIHIQKQGSELLVRLDRLHVGSRANARRARQQA
jgi:peptidoglycan/xylan/chitin deacetylase (PgdA/CDA1 family)